MKFALSIVSALIFLNTVANISDLRADFHKMQNHEDVNEFIKKYDNFSDEKGSAYVAAAIMRKAEYVFFPHDKLKYFNQGKKRLEAYIKNNPNCIEGRYVRVLVQSKVPRILNYNDNIDTDISYIKYHISEAELPLKYKTLILENIEVV